MNFLFNQKFDSTSINISSYGVYPNPSLLSCHFMPSYIILSFSLESSSSSLSLSLSSLLPHHYLWTLLSNVPLILASQLCYHRYISLRFIWLFFITTSHGPRFQWGYNQLGHNNYYHVTLNQSLRVDQRLLTIMVYEGT